MMLIPLIVVSLSAFTGAGLVCEAMAFTVPLPSWTNRRVSLHAILSINQMIHIHMCSKPVQYSLKSMNLKTRKHVKGLLPPVGNSSISDKMCTAITDLNRVREDWQYTQKALFPELHLLPYNLVV